MGRGLKASADIFFSNGEVITFAPLRDLLNPNALKGEVALATGATPKVTGETAPRVLKLLREMAERHDALTDDENAIEWGVTYLQSAQFEACDIADRQGDRWRAFSDLRRYDEDARREGRPPFWVRTVLVDRDGQRYVRSQLFCDYVRKTQDPKAGNNAEIVNRMLRVGWERRATEGRINAARPGFPGQLSWAFLEVRPGWEKGR